MQLVRLVKECIEIEAHLENDSISTLQFKGSSFLVDCYQAAVVVGCQASGSSEVKMRRKGRHAGGVFTGGYMVSYKGTGHLLSVAYTGTICAPLRRMVLYN